MGKPTPPPKVEREKNGRARVRRLTPEEYEVPKHDTLHVTRTTYVLAFKQVLAPPYGERWLYFIEYEREGPPQHSGYLNVCFAWAKQFATLAEAVKVGWAWVADPDTRQTEFSILEQKVEHRWVFNSDDEKTRRVKDRGRQMHKTLDEECSK